jgi:hypothetical protein
VPLVVVVVTPPLLDPPLLVPVVDVSLPLPHASCNMRPLPSTNSR